MKQQARNCRMAFETAAVFFFLLLSPLSLSAQNATSATKPPVADQFAGNYKGSAKSPEGDTRLNMEIKSEKGKISGRLVTLQGEQPFTSGEVVDGKLTLKFGAAANAGVLTLQLRDDKLAGEWKAGAKTRAVEFQKVPAAPTDPAVAEVKKPAEPATADLLSGEWDAAADAQGQAFPFTLTLKLDGDKVTGSSSSQLGNSTISSGSWKDGKLAVVLEGGNGQVALIATIVDGKLVGDYDFAGQLSGKWVATKKQQ
jgi:hypothetical protein